MSIIRRISLVAIVCSAACWRVGQTGATLDLARSPNGATVTVSLPTQDVVGELLAVRDDGLIIREASGLQLVPYTSIQRVRVRELPDYSIGAGVPGAYKRSRLNSISRYPQGISSELERTLLSKSGQRELEVIR